MKIKNMVRDLSEEQRKTVLKGIADSEPSVFVGMTLGQYIIENSLSDYTLMQLCEWMEADRLEWPFRLVNVDVEASLCRRFRLPILEDEVMTALENHTIDIDALDREFSLDGANVQVWCDILDCCGVVYDYTVINDRGQTIRPWNHDVHGADRVKDTDK